MKEKKKLEANLHNQSTQLDGLQTEPSDLKVDLEEANMGGLLYGDHGFEKVKEKYVACILRST